MVDVHDNATRSFNMSRIRSKNTKPEIIVRKFLFSKGYRFRLHNKDLPGRPDITLPKYSTVIFVHGCFWHGHDGCNYYVVPSTRTEWWLNKINRNKERDTRNVKELEAMQWKIITIFECDLKKDKIEDTFNNIIKMIGKDGNSCN
jgi:DNA mismatch endonuclease (patch repair protein)